MNNASVMRKFIFLIIMSLLFSCNIDDKCGEIIDKVIDDNRFLLVIRFDSGGGTNQGDFDGELVDDIEVNEEIFSSFDEGDNYCVE